MLAKGGLGSNTTQNGKIRAISILTYLRDICQVEVASEDGWIIAVLHMDDDLRLVDVVAADRAPVLSQDSQDIAILRLPVEPLVDKDDTSLVVDAETGRVGGSHEEVEDLALLASICVLRLDLQFQ